MTFRGNCVALRVRGFTARSSATEERDNVPAGFKLGIYPGVCRIWEIRQLGHCQIHGYLSCGGLDGMDRGHKELLAARAHEAG